MQFLRPDDFKKMAQEVVNAYLTRSIPLVDSIVKIAIENGLNPDQIHNLVRLANTMAHLTLFDQKTDGDKIIEFEPADPEIVMKRIYIDNPPEQSDSDSCGTDSADVETIKDMFSDFSETLNKIKDVLTEKSTTDVPEGVKPTSPENSESETKETISPAKQQMLIIRIRKVAEVLKTKQHEIAQEYQEELNKLAADFAKLYGPDFEEFEKDALALRGRAALPVLADLRHCLRLGGQSDISLTKVARVVDATTPEMRALDRLIKLAEDWINHRDALNYLQTEVGAVL